MSTDVRAAWYARRREQGLCPKCPEPLVSGKSRCQAHLAQQREASAARVNRLTLARLCIDCAQRSPVRGRYCGPCGVMHRESLARTTSDPHYQAKLREKYRQRRRERIAAGRCAVCGLVSPFEGYRHCADCLQEHRNACARRRHKLARLGRCTHCGGERDRDGYLVCLHCLTTSLESMHRLYLSRRQAGRCVACGIADAETDLAKCRPCHERTMVYQREYLQVQRNQRTAKGLTA